MSILDTIRRWFSSPPEPKKQKTPRPNDRQVWIVRGGRVYHLYPGCPTIKRIRKTPIKTTCSKARAQGLRECGMCREMLDRAARV